MQQLVSSSKRTKPRKAFVFLRQRILSGELPPGTHLTLRPIARSLSMSVGCVSEAIRELAHEGLVTVEPHYGARVVEFDAVAIRNHHILRIAIECEAIRRCTERITARQLDELREQAIEVDRLTDVEEKLDQARAADERFHLRICELSGASSLVQALKSTPLVQLLAVESASDVDAIAHRKHIEIVSAVESRDPAAAERVMRQHCERSLQLQLFRHQNTDSTAS